METALMILQMAVELSLYNYRHKCAILHHQPSLSKSDWYSCYVHILYSGVLKNIGTDYLVQHSDICPL